MDFADDWELDPGAWVAAVDRINALYAGARPPAPEDRYETGDFAPATSLGALLQDYDYGEPSHNGALMLLAKHSLKAGPTTRNVTSIEELTPVESEYISYFHHGDVIVDGDFGAFDSVWITGNLQVKGVIEASYLDAFADLMVGGDVTCEAIQFMGLSLVAGSLKARRFAFVHSQGENWVLGGIETPVLAGEWQSAEPFDSLHCDEVIDLEEQSIEMIAAALQTPVLPSDEHGFDVVYRAFELHRAVDSPD